MCSPTPKSTLVASDPAPTIFPDVICKAVPLVEAELIPAGAKPLELPLFVIVTPEGIVKVSPESPKVTFVPPDTGAILFTSIVLIR